MLRMKILERAASCPRFLLGFQIVEQGVQPLGHPSQTTGDIFGATGGF